MVGLASLHAHLQLLLSQPAFLGELANEEVAQIFGEAIGISACTLHIGTLILGYFFVGLLLDVLEEVEGISVDAVGEDGRLSLT